jgi:peptidoglycan hydrolase CwlO-like protein
MSKQTTLPVILNNSLIEELQTDKNSLRNKRLKVYEQYNHALAESKDDNDPKVIELEQVMDSLDDTEGRVSRDITYLKKQNMRFP